MSAPNSPDVSDEDVRRPRSPAASFDDEEPRRSDDMGKSNIQRRGPLEMPEDDDSDAEAAAPSRPAASRVKQEFEPSPSRRAAVPDSEDEDDYGSSRRRSHGNVRDDKIEDEISPSPRTTGRAPSSPARKAHSDDEGDASRYGSDSDAGYAANGRDRKRIGKRGALRKRRDLSDDEYRSDDGEGRGGHGGESRAKKQKTSSRGGIEDDGAGDADRAPELHDDPEDDVKPERKKSAFDLALEKAKSGRRTRVKELDPRAIESECIAFLERMMKAREEDLTAFNRGRPALEKIRMLRDVEMMMMKVQHREYLLDNMLLPVIGAWLVRLPDGTLPNVQVRTTLLQILLDLRMDDDWVERLESSQGLGKIIHFLSRNDDYDPNRRLAEKIMMKWARPVYKMKSNFHDLLDEFDKPEEGHRAPKDSVASERKAAMRTVRRLKTTEEKLKSFRNKKEDTRVMASIPRSTPFLFTTVAEGSSTVDENVVKEVRSNKAKTKKVNRTMSNLRRMNKRRMSSGVKPSINGR